MKGFVRKKIIGGKPRYYLVQSYRNDEGKPRNRYLAYLSEHPTIAARVAYLRRSVRKWTRQRTNLEREKAQCDEAIESVKGREFYDYTIPEQEKLKAKAEAGIARYNAAILKAEGQLNILRACSA